MASRSPGPGREVRTSRILSRATPTPSSTPSRVAPFRSGHQGQLRPAARPTDAESRPVRFTTSEGRSARLAPCTKSVEMSFRSCSAARGWRSSTGSHQAAASCVAPTPVESRCGSAAAASRAGVAPTSSNVGKVDGSWRPVPR